jgi:hypothetical protein
MLRNRLVLLTFFALFAACGGTEITTGAGSTNDSTANPPTGQGLYIEAYTINLSTGANGTVSSFGLPVAAGSMIVGKSSSVSFVVTPNDGYLIDDVVVDGVSQGAIATRTFQYDFVDIQADHSVDVQFKSRTVWVDVTAAIATGVCADIKTRLNEYALGFTNFCVFDTDPNNIKMNIMMILAGLCPSDVLTAASANLYARVDGCLGNAAAACVTVRTYIQAPFSYDLLEATKILHCIP